MNFRNFVIISPSKRVGPSFKKKTTKETWIPFTQWYLVPSFVEICPVVLKKIFLCPLFRYYLCMEKGGALHLNNIESPSQKDNLAKLVYIAQWFWRRRFFKMCHWFFFQNRYFPLWKGRRPSFEQTWIPFTQGHFVPSLVEICPLVQETMFFLNSSLDFYYFNFPSDGHNISDKYKKMLKCKNL